jgi:hypothetical protein
LTVPPGLGCGPEATVVEDPTTCRIGAGCFWLAVDPLVVTFDVDLAAAVVAVEAFAVDTVAAATSVEDVAPATVVVVSPVTAVVDSSVDVVGVVAEVAFFPEPPPHAAAMTATAVAAVIRRQLGRDRIGFPPRTRGLSADADRLSARSIV